MYRFLYRYKPLSRTPLREIAFAMAPSEIKPSQLADAVLSSVLDGSYPDSDDVAGAILEASALPEIVASLQNARESLYVQFLLNLRS